MVESTIDLAVVGSGGNGQSYFMRFLNENGLTINCHGNFDGLKHSKDCNLCTKKVKDVKKVIFLYNDPLMSILSHFRRNWSRTQLRKLGNPFKLDDETSKNTKLLWEKTLENKRDIYGVEYQFDNWINSETSFPVLYLDFNEILQQKYLIDKFVGKQLDWSLFEIEKRRSKIDNDISDEIINIYQKLYSKIKSQSKEHNDKLLKNHPEYAKTEDN